MLAVCGALAPLSGSRQQEQVLDEQRARVSSEHGGRARELEKEAQRQERSQEDQHRGRDHMEQQRRTKLTLIAIVRTLLAAASIGYGKIK